LRSGLGATVCPLLVSRKARTVWSEH